MPACLCVVCLRLVIEFLDIELVLDCDGAERWKEWGKHDT